MNSGRLPHKIQVMKKNILVAAVFFIAFCTITTAQPLAVQIAFKQKFTKVVQVSWSNENGTLWQADFKIDQIKYSAVYTPQGIWIETIRVIKLNELPTFVRNSIFTKFPNWEITEMNKTEKAKGGVSFEVNLKKGRDRKNIAFKEDGSIIQ